MNKIKSLVLVLAVTAGISVFATPSNYYYNKNLLVNTNSVKTQTTEKSVSEVMIFLYRTEAEKHFDLNSGFCVEFEG